MAILEDTPVITPTGFLLAKDLKTTDFLYGTDGEPIRIRSIQSYQSEDIYTAIFLDGTRVSGDKHLALPYTNKKAYTLEHIAKTGTRRKDNPKKYKYRIPCCKPIELPTKDFPVPPYVAALWYLSKRQYSEHYIPDETVREVEKKLRRQGYMLTKATPAAGHPRYNIRPSIKFSFLTKYPTSPTEIPEEYFYGNREQRIELLRGFLHARPYWKNSFRYEIASRSLKFLRQLQFLCESLGIKTSLQRDSSKYPTYMLHFRSGIPFFENENIFEPKLRDSYRTLGDIVKGKPANCIHITTDKPFIACEGFLPIC